MNERLTESALALVAVGLLTALMTLSPVDAAAADAIIPVAQQNDLVRRYCAVCHTDASKNGGLSLEHFDAARPDPGDAAMVVSKMKSGAFGAAGIPPPDKATQQALIAALSTAGAGASEWTVRRSENAKSATPGGSTLAVSIVQRVASTANNGDPDLYRLTLTCRADTREGEMQLTWSPNVPENGRELSAAADGHAPLTYKAEGAERMGNGTAGTSGPGSVVLRAMPLPAQTLTISNVFPDQRVVFPFSTLTSAARQALSVCFAGS